jgi:hypothetical protein
MPVFLKAKRYSGNAPFLKKAPWLESPSKLYRPSEHHVSTKFVPTFADRGVSRGQLDGSPTAVFSDF